ncbi:MAG: HAD family phosphatase [Deltaproteobacteria bacterium]|nr:HAD family phosphatase [Nannocystaceae bacterium]
MKLRAAIFDLNGTLVDDIAYHYRAWKALGDRHGFAMDEAIFQSINGFKNEDIFPRLMGGEVEPARMQALAEEKEDMYRELYRPHLAPLAGAEALLDRLRAAGVKLAVASSAPIRNRELVIEGLDWHDRFDLVVANENLRGKPAPDIFLAAAERLAVPPGECLVFEDAVNGVNAAKAAGITCVGVTTNVSAAELREAGAVLTIPDFEGLPEDLDGLLA